MNKSIEPFLSIVIPVYNEERRIKNLSEIIFYLKKQKYSWEVIIVDDGSTDKTSKILKLLKKKLRFTLISYQPNSGKGFAVKTGMLSAKGKFRLFLDVDLSTPISEMEKFLPYLKKHPIVIGSRKLKASILLTRQPLFREYLGKIFTLLSQAVLRLDISDFTCGFKCFSKDAAEEIFKRQTIKGWGFDSEILYIGKLKKISAKELPIVWKNDPRTRVKFPKDIINSLFELTKIRINSAMGLYK